MFVVFNHLSTNVSRIFVVVVVVLRVAAFSNFYSYFFLILEKKSI